jgi:hypothetical protein
MSDSLRLLLSAIAGTALGMIVFRFVAWAMRGAKDSPPGAGALGWALLFLSSGRMPPPPPASVIQLELDGEKARLGADPAELGNKNIREVEECYAVYLR